MPQPGQHPEIAREEVVGVELGAVGVHVSNPKDLRRLFGALLLVQVHRHLAEAAGKRDLGLLRERLLGKHEH